MTYTTASEDRIIEACEDFGGKAAELVEIINRFDAWIDRQQRRIGELESEVEVLEQELEEVRS